MAGTTPRFGLNFFGGSIEGSLEDDGGKYTAADRLLLDKILAAMEVNDYHRHAAYDTTSAAPTATLLQTGALEGGTSYFYKVAIVDAQGFEGAASAETAVSTPSILQAPDAPAGNVLDTGANPGQGQYYYALTTLRNAEESTLGDIETVTVLPGDGSVELTLPAIAEADSTGVRVWRMADDESGYTKIGIATHGATTFTDDGSVPPDPCPTDPDNQPPDTPQGLDIYSVQVTLSTADQAKLAHASAWRIYRTEVAGSYASDALVHQVVERQNDLDPTSPLLTTWLDDGDELSTGTPALSDRSLNLRPFVFDSASTLPSPAGYPAYYPLVVAGTLYVKLGTAWEAVTGGGGGGGGGAPQAATTPWPDYLFTGSDGRRWRQTVDVNGAIVMVETLVPGAPTPPVTTVSVV